MQELESIFCSDMTEYGFETRESIEKDLDDFFGGADEKTEGAPKDRVKFIISPGEKKEDVISFLEEQGVEYDEK